MLGRVRRAAASLALTSLIAGLATAPLAAFHFQRVAPLTLVANLAAMPLVGTMVMPMALAALVLMPFGLEALPLTVMGWGLDWVTAVAGKMAAWSAGHGVVAAMPLLALGLTAGGFLWLALWRERWRLVGLVPMALAVPVALTAPHPDVLIDDRGITVAVRGADGRYAIVNGKGETFVVDNWLRADGDGREPGAPTWPQASPAIRSAAWRRSGRTARRWPSPARRRAGGGLPHGGGGGVALRGAGGLPRPRLRHRPARRGAPRRPRALCDGQRRRGPAGLPGDDRLSGHAAALHAAAARISSGG